MPAQALVSEPVDALAKLREPFADNLVSKLSKETRAQKEERERDRGKGIRCQQCRTWHHKDALHVDYIGHAAITHRLLEIDPLWTWEPVALGPDGLPALDREGGLWIRLTIAGMTRLGYGNGATKPQQGPGDRMKEVIGDALRNGAMRFGAGLDLWHKGDLHAEEVEGEPVVSMEERAITHLQACAVSREMFKDGWEKNKDGWKKAMDGAAYARVVTAMKVIAGTLPEDPKPEPAPEGEKPVETFDVLEGDEIPF